MSGLLSDILVKPSQGLERRQGASKSGAFPSGFGGGGGHSRSPTLLWPGQSAKEHPPPPPPHRARGTSASLSFSWLSSWGHGGGVGATLCQAQLRPLRPQKNERAPGGEGCSATCECWGQAGCLALALFFSGAPCQSLAVWSPIAHLWANQPEQGKESDTCGIRTHAGRPHRLSRPTP